MILNKSNYFSQFKTINLEELRSIPLVVFIKNFSDINSTIALYKTLDIGLNINFVTTSFSTMVKLVKEDNYGSILLENFIPTDSEFSLLKIPFIETSEISLIYNQTSINNKYMYKILEFIKNNFNLMIDKR